MATRRHSALRGRLLTSATLFALIAAPAAAQETGGFFYTLGRIILGAGVAKVAIDTPQAVSTLEQEDLDRAQPNTLSDLFKNIPGVQAAGASVRALGQAFNIRGIGNTEQTASESRIIVTVDGAPKFFEQYRMGSFFGDFELFKRVEVLRGPASSTLYGSGAIGGTVAFTTKDASDFLEDGETTALRFKTGLESNGETKKLGLIWAQRYGNAETLAALNYSSGGTIKDGSGTDIAGSEHQSWSGLVKSTWRFGNDDDQTLTLSLSRTDTDLDDALVAQTGGAAASGFGTNDIHTIDDTVTLTWRNEVADNPLLDLTVQLSYTDTTADKTDFSYGFLCAPGRMQVLCDGTYGYETTTLKVENLADLSAGAWKNYITFGAQLSQMERTAMTTVGEPAYHPGGTDEKLGLYAQGEFTWNDRLTLIPGVRVDFGQVTPSAAAVALGGTAQEDTAVSPKLAVMYKLSEEVSVFGSLAHTERLPTLDELYSSELASTSGGVTYVPRDPSLNLEKEEADAVELGLAWQKTGLLAEDDSLQLKLTAFHNDLTNMIATTARPAVGGAVTSVPYYSNIASAKIWGAELEGGYDAERWFANLAWSIVKSKDGTTGLTLADTPAQNVALTLGAKFPAQNLVIGWRAYWFDDITTSSATTTAEGYNLHDIFLTWTPDEGVLQGFAVNLAVENVFDTTYRNNLALDNGAGRNAKLSVTKQISW